MYTFYSYTYGNRDLPSAVDRVISLAELSSLEELGESE